MLKEKGIVTQIDKDYAWVNTRSKLSCSSCQVESACGNALLEKYLSDRLFMSKVPNKIQAQVGDEVEIQIHQSSVTKAALWLYGMPLLLFILTAISTDLFFDNEVPVIIISFTTLFISYMILHKLIHKVGDLEDFQPRIQMSKQGKFAEIANLNLNLIDIKNL
ncbi:MAG: SoxR reducing system RseC family protein [Gammaproteobacteria bacterium]|nr:SoxR reducing system RseC family protein [Gammaproteobacteria bacterium]MDH5629932.1 SoxR reducing system RseC family protein [Gammaproteobacteria bacterium]